MTTFCIALGLASIGLLVVALGILLWSMARLVEAVGIDVEALKEELGEEDHLGI